MAAGVGSRGIVDIDWGVDQGFELIAGAIETVEVVGVGMTTRHCRRLGRDCCGGGVVGGGGRRRDGGRVGGAGGSDG